MSSTNLVPCRVPENSLVTIQFRVGMLGRADTAGAGTQDPNAPENLPMVGGIEGDVSLPALEKCGAGSSNTFLGESFAATEPAGLFTMAGCQSSPFCNGCAMSYSAPASLAPDCTPVNCAPCQSLHLGDGIPFPVSPEGLPGNVAPNMPAALDMTAGSYRGTYNFGELHDPYTPVCPYSSQRIPMPHDVVAVPLFPTSLMEASEFSMSSGPSTLNEFPSQPVLDDGLYDGQMAVDDAVLFASLTVPVGGVFADHDHVNPAEPSQCAKNSNFTDTMSSYAPDRPGSLTLAAPAGGVDDRYIEIQDYVGLIVRDAEDDDTSPGYGADSLPNLSQDLYSTRP